MKRLCLIPIFLILLVTACETTLPDVVEGEDSPEPATAAVPESAPPQTTQEPAPEQPKTGGLTLTFTTFDGGDAMPVHSRIFPQGQSGEPAAESSGPAAVFTLPPGNYSLTAAWDTGSVRFDGLSVAAGRLTERTISLDTGTLSLTFTDIPGGEQVKTAYSLYKAGDRDTPLASGTSADSLVLAEGLYDLHVEETDAWTEGIPVQAGSITERTIVLSLATLSVRFLDPATGEPGWAEYRVHPAGAWQEILVWDSGDGFTGYLEEGVYDVYYAWDGSEAWLKNINLLPGSLVEREILLTKD